MSEKKCSLCGGDIVRGHAAIKKSWIAWLSWPFEKDRLEFISDRAAGITETIIRQDTDYEAFKCVQCGALLLTQNTWTS
jgi:hypothetical protein